MVTAIKVDAFGFGAISIVLGVLGLIFGSANGSGAIKLALAVIAAGAVLCFLSSDDNLTGSSFVNALIYAGVFGGVLGIASLIIR